MKALTEHKQSIIKLEFMSWQDKEYMGHSTETEATKSEPICYASKET